MASPGAGVRVDNNDMAVEKIDSPTELAAESDDEELEPKIEKRKRETTVRRRRRNECRDATAVPDGTDDELDSPSKRALVEGGRSDERPLTAGLLKDLLADHRRDMQQAWNVFEDRVGKVENQQIKQTGELASLGGRMKINEKDIATAKKNQALGDRKVEKLTEDVANLKVQFEGVSAKISGMHPHQSDPHDNGGGIGSDPWSEYLKRNRLWTPLPGPSKASTSMDGVNFGQAASGGGDMGDQLTDEDRRTLIVGGWLQDTRRATIEEEAATLLQHAEIRPLIDVDKLAVYGPRRSVGMLKFTQRDDERNLEEMKSRMWKVVRKVAELKVSVESSKAAGEERKMWAAFVKTKTARTRSAHISMVRRVVTGLAADAKNEAGGVLNFEHTQDGAYDMD